MVVMLIVAMTIVCVLSPSYSVLNRTTEPTAENLIEEAQQKFPLFVRYTTVMFGEYRVVEITHNGETHEYIRCNDGLTHSASCKYCRETKNK